MIEQDALGIVKALADGVDPVSGEVFPEDSPYKHIIIKKALCAAATILEEMVKKQNRKMSLPKRSGKPWDRTEAELLIKKYDNGIEIEDLAKEHQRTYGSIKSQLTKLGKIELPYMRKN